jgi:hypothetical protein
MEINMRSIIGVFLFLVCFFSGVFCFGGEGVGFASGGAGVLRSVYGVEEIVFARRKMGVDSHWYGNIGYYAGDESKKTYRSGGQLC